MKKKLLLALPLVGLLCSCSYGSIAELNLSEFKNFYNSRDLKNQKDYIFKLGDDIELTDDSDDNGTHVYNGVNLSTSAISSWEKDGKGSRISFNYSYLYGGINDEDSKYQVVEGYLSFVSKKEYEEPENEGDEPVLIGQSATYTLSFFLNSSIEDGYQSYASEQKLVRYEFYPVVESEGEEAKEEFEKEASYVRYSFNYAFDYTQINGDETARTIHESSVSVSADYYDYIEYGNKKVLSYKSVTSDIYTNEVYDDAQKSFVGSTRVTEKVTRTTSYDERSETGKTPKGEEVTIHKEEIYEDGVYKKDTEHSTEDTDDTYRYTVSEDFVLQFEVENLVKLIKDNSYLTLVLNKATMLMKSYFVEFESYLNSGEKNEEIIQLGNVYQFRVALNDNTIKQFSFYHGEEHDTLTSIITFDKQTLQELYNITVIY